MAKNNNHTVHKRDDGQWGNLRNGNQRDTSVHSTQREAINAAKQDVAKHGGGEVTWQGKNGKFIGKDTVAPGNDDYPPKG